MIDRLSCFQSSNRDIQSLAARFWGDNWYDHRSKSWSESPISDSGAKLKRAFVEFVLEPIYSFRVRILLCRLVAHSDMNNFLGRLH